MQGTALTLPLESRDVACWRVGLVMIWLNILAGSPTKTSQPKFMTMTHWPRFHVVDPLMYGTDGVTSSCNLPNISRWLDTAHLALSSYLVRAMWSFISFKIHGRDFRPFINNGNDRLIFYKGFKVGDLDFQMACILWEISTLRWPWWSPWP